MSTSEQMSRAFSIFVIESHGEREGFLVKRAERRMPARQYTAHLPWFMQPHWRRCYPRRRFVFVPPSCRYGIQQNLDRKSGESKSWNNEAVWLSRETRLLAEERQWYRTFYFKKSFYKKEFKNSLNFFKN